MNDNTDQPFRARLQEALSIVKWLDCKEDDLETVLNITPIEIRTDRSMKHLIERLKSMVGSEAINAILRAINQLCGDPQALTILKGLVSEIAFHPDLVRAIKEIVLL